MGPCDGCHAGCCRSFAVPITGADILRIERATSRTFDDFACRWADPDGKVARRISPHFYFADEPQTPFVICFRHDDSVTHPSTSKCGFLVEEPATEAKPLGTAHCGLYEHRPYACRSFPMKLNATGELTILYDVPQRGRKDDHPAYTLCPRPWRPDEVDPIQAPQDLAVMKFEMDFFHTVAFAWNRTPRSFEDFPAFIRFVYANRVLSAEGGRATVPAIGTSNRAA